MRTKSNGFFQLAAGAMAAFAVALPACNITSVKAVNLSQSVTRISVVGDNSVGVSGRWFVKFGVQGGPQVFQSGMSAALSAGRVCTTATANTAGCFVDLRVSPGASYVATVHAAYGSSANSISQVDCLNLANGTVWDSASGECTATLGKTISFTSMAASTASPASVPVLSVNGNTGRLPRPVTNFYGALSEVTVRDDGYSIPFKNGVLFMFGDTVVINPVDGEFRAMPSSTAILTKGGAEYVSGGILDFTREPTFGSPNQELTRGAHAETLALSATEKANGVRIAYWNAGGVPTPGSNNQEAQVFFGRFRIGCKKISDGTLRPMKTCNKDLGEGEFFENTGIYADRLRASATLTRTDGIVVPAITTDNAKSVMFDGTKLRFRPSGLVEGGYAYFLAGNKVTSTMAHFYMARVPQNDVRNIAAFSYWDGTKYQSDISLAKPISDSTIYSTVGQGTISYNAHLGRYVMVDQIINLNDGRILVANRPEGPWTPVANITGLPTIGTYGNYFFMEHPALQRNNGKTIVISYSNMPALGQQNLQMVEVTFN